MELVKSSISLRVFPLVLEFCPRQLEVEALGAMGWHELYRGISQLSDARRRELLARINPAAVESIRDERDDQEIIETVIDAINKAVGR